MSGKKPLSPAQFVDRFMTLVALGVLLIALAYAAAVFQYLLGGSQAASFFNIASTALGLLAIAVVLPQFVQLIRKRRSLGIGRDEPEGFVTDVYKRAAEKGFSFTFIFLLFMDVVTGRYFETLPSEITVKIIIAVSLAIFSLSFFIMSRGVEADDDFSEAGDL